MKKSILLFSVLVTGLFVACKKENNAEIQPKAPNVKLMNGTYSFPDDSFYVTQVEVVGIAEKYTAATFNYGVVDMKTMREIDDVYPILDRKGQPGFYVVNYSYGEGTIIFSADYRFEPIVYFSTSGYLKPTDTLPNSFHNILNVYMRKIEALRYDRDVIDVTTYMAQYNAGVQGWSYLDNLFEKCCLHPSDNIRVPGWDPCANFNYPPPYIISPLITTRWEQDNPYNRLCEPIVNNPVCSGQIPAIGCVGIAVGQVVRYTQPVTQWNYNYSQMGDVVFAFNQPGEVERLLEMCYKTTAQISACSYTSSTTVNARMTLNNNFGIPSATRDGSINSNSLTVKDRIVEQLENGWPLILGGTTGTDNAVSWPSFRHAHSWVLDGYRHEKYCTYTNSYFHMNWGWAWNVAAGWCLWNNWSPQGTGREYDLFLSMIYDIHN